MNAMDHFLARGVRLELVSGNNIRAIGHLDDGLRADIKAQKAQIVGELQWREFESLLAIVAPAYNTPEPEYAEIREAARRDLPAALESYRTLSKERR